jgi:apolipoprotein D and lipocalin family protein
MNTISKSFSFFILSLTFSLMACAHIAPVQTVSFVDLNKYQGTWHEIAKYPNSFQKGCVKSMAEYELKANGTVSVLNTCTFKNGNLKTGKGFAWVVDKTTNAKLKVRFYNWFSNLFPWLTQGDYWILNLDEGYEHVIVGSPDRKYLWILARAETMNEQTYHELLGIIKTLGFKPEQLVKN